MTICELNILAFSFKCILRKLPIVFIRLFQYNHITLQVHGSITCIIAMKINEYNN